MRVAYLFAESDPNYDIDFQILSALSSDELNSLDTVVRTGVWGLFDRLEDREDAVDRRLAKLFYGGEGNISWTDNERLVEAIRLGLIYTVQFQSLSRPLALGLHQKLKKRSGNYLGFIQVLADTWPHHLVFRGCPPRYEFARGKVFVLYPSINGEEDNEERVADEIISYWKDRYNSLEYMPLTSSLRKRDIRSRYSILDENDGISSDVTVQGAIQILAEIWDVHVEQTLYGLQDVAPLAKDELFAALNILKKTSHSPADVRQIAVSFRGVLEAITREYFEDVEEVGPWVNNRWQQYLKEIEQENITENGKKKRAHERTGTYETVVGHEALDLDNIIARSLSLYDMGHKGVHEAWDVNIFHGIALRLVMLLWDLMRKKQGKKAMKLDQNSLRLILDDE